MSQQFSQVTASYEGSAAGRALSLGFTTNICGRAQNALSPRSGHRPGRRPRGPTHAPSAVGSALLSPFGPRDRKCVAGKTIRPKRSTHPVDRESLREWFHVDHPQRYAQRWTTL